MIIRIELRPLDDVTRCRNSLSDRYYASRLVIVLRPAPLTVSLKTVDRYGDWPRR